ncbi:MAG: hypothetical protein GY774_39540 [Planctomycetes bacterium]|nr:hypothetical protein [Planctomycetota bacterium]
MKPLRNSIFILMIVGLLTIVGCGGDGDDGGATAPELLVGTWDLTQDEDGNAVDPGTVTLVLTDTTYDVTSPDCRLTGTYTADSTTITATVGTTDGSDCEDSPGDVNVVKYTVNSATLTITDDGDTQILNRL